MVDIRIMYTLGICEKIGIRKSLLQKSMKCICENARDSEIPPTEEPEMYMRKYVGIRKSLLQKSPEMYMCFHNSS